jgi:lysine-N-methylase
MCVLIDKATYDKYQDFPQGEFRSLAQQYVSLNTIDASDTLYAKIVPNESNSCPFLTTERLCNMQKEFGHEYLSATCSIYPRVLNSVNGELETSLYLSCPEAARLVLLNPDSTQAEGNVASGHFRTDQFSRLGNNDGPIYKPFSYFEEIQALVVMMIKDRTRPMWQRLFLLGMFCSALNNITTPERESAVPEIISNYKELIAKVGLREELNAIPANPVLQLDVVLRLVDQRVRAGANTERFLECWQDFICGIGYSPDSTPAKDGKRYAEVEEEFCRPFFAKHPHILENYLLNYVFRTLFPMGRAASAHNTPKSILDEYTLMITQYSLVKGLLNGMAGHYKENFDATHVVKLVQSFSKAVEHNLTFLKDMGEFIKSRNLGTVDGFAVLLANGEKAAKVAEVAAGAKSTVEVA